jgi:dipeptidase
MDLVRLALERAHDAAEACAVIASLLEQHGQGGGCGHENKRFTYHNSFLIADPHDAYVLETAGRHWAKERVLGVRTISNGLTIPGFADRFSAPVATRASGSRLRQQRTHELAARSVGPADLFALLRDHGAADACPRYSWVNGGLGAPCVHAGGLLSAAQTTASWVADLRPGGCVHWVTAMASPCTSLFKPVRVDEPLNLGPAPCDRADADSLWWRHERFSRRVLMNPQGLMPFFQCQRDEVETRWLAKPPEGRAAFAEGDALLAEWTRTVVSRPAKDTRPFWVRVCWARRNRWAGLNA